MDTPGSPTAPGIPTSGGAPAPGAVLDRLGFAARVGLSDADSVVLELGAPDEPRPLASVSKPITALGALVAVARSQMELDEPAGPPGSTVRHLLAHTAGYGFDTPREQVLAAPGTRRIYSNTGFEVLAEHLEEATGYDMAEWLEQQVIAPLGLTDLDVTGSPAAGYTGTVSDLLAIGRELLRPTLIPADLWREATSVQFPGLAGILPGYGRQKPNDWGLGLEIRDHKQPHWTGADSSPATFGHFGQSGSFLWVDPQRGLAAAFLGAEPFGPAHIEAWPGLSDALVATAQQEGQGA